MWNLSLIARGTPGFAGADLANLVNEAALAAARQNRKVVTQSDFETAKDKVLMGVERKSLIMSDKEKRTTAYHEAGHALVAALMECRSAAQSHHHSTRHGARLDDATSARR